MSKETQSKKMVGQYNNTIVLFTSVTKFAYGLIPSSIINPKGKKGSLLSIFKHYLQKNPQTGVNTNALSGAPISADTAKLITDRCVRVQIELRKYKIRITNLQNKIKKLKESEPNRSEIGSLESRIKIYKPKGIALVRLQNQLKAAKNRFTKQSKEFNTMKKQQLEPLLKERADLKTEILTYVETTFLT